MTLIQHCITHWVYKVGGLDWLDSRWNWRLYRLELVNNLDIFVSFDFLSIFKSCKLQETYKRQNRTYGKIQKM